MPLPRGHVPLERALSKLRLASRRDAQNLIRSGRVSVNDQIVTDPLRPVVPERDRFVVDGAPATPRAATRLIAFHKPRGVVTTKRDPEGRQTVFDVLGDAGHDLVAVGRLDRASSGLLLLTNDTQLANALTDPKNGVVRRYVVTVRGEVTDAEARQLEQGIAVGGATDRLRASRVEIRKRSHRETHLIVELTEGKNREVRRLFAAIDGEVTRLLRVQFGDWALGTLAPGEWKMVDWHK